MQNWKEIRKFSSSKIKCNSERDCILQDVSFPNKYSRLLLNTIFFKDLIERKLPCILNILKFSQAVVFITCILLIAAALEEKQSKE